MSEQAKHKADQLEELRIACENNLWIYACTVEPHRVYGRCHQELYEWWQCQIADGYENLLALMPRDHQKSHCAAVATTWFITKEPSITIIYLSATSSLAERQLDDIKQILESHPHRTLWPQMINPVESKREMWNQAAIKVDHPDREKEGVRDPTVAIAGMTTNTTGWHCKLLVKDDVVVPENAYTEEGRRKVEAKCSQLSSILTTGGIELVVGTRYHPNDHYNTCKELMEEVVDEDGFLIDETHVYSVYERQVEVNGVFLWPRQARESDGKMFGFDWAQLNRKKAKYTDKRQFFAQYYNNPNMVDQDTINSDMFMYYDQRHLNEKDGTWFIGEEPLALYAAMDFAYSKAAGADWTAIVVIGITPNGDVYILDMHRFKTDKYANYFAEAEKRALKWGFRNLLLETTAAQVVIANYIKDKFVEANIKMKVAHHKPNRAMGAKEERIDAALTPLYEDQKVYHYRSGIINMLEEELSQKTPAHDDLKDVLAACISWEKAKPARKIRKQEEDNSMKPYTRPSRFGGYRG